MYAAPLSTVAALNIRLTSAVTTARRNWSALNSTQKRELRATASHVRDHGPYLCEPPPPPVHEPQTHLRFVLMSADRTCSRVRSRAYGCAHICGPYSCLYVP